MLPIDRLPLPPSTTWVASRYQLLRQLGIGGMAEVWLARQTGLEGFEKLVVLKRILPSLAADPQFVQMFLDEARTAADLRHPNLVSVTDVGLDAGRHFIVMEYLHGRDLFQVVQRCLKLSEQVPLAHALQIVSDAARGLDYAHRKVDLRGAAQQIVHRDVSPQNVFVTYEGATRVLDFGIAHASRRVTQTEAGVLKGKAGYVSPEQLEDLELDARSDQFALAVVLFELLTLQPLFAGRSEGDRLRAVLACAVPAPSTLRHELPRGLDEVVLKALERDPRRRFASCAEFSEALEECLVMRRIPHSPARAGAWLRGLFPEHRNAPTAVEEEVRTFGARTRSERLSA